MTSYSKMAEAMTIFARYGRSQGIDAQHDIIRAGPDPRNVSPEDLKRLAELDWDPDTEYDCFYYFT